MVIGVPKPLLPLPRMRAVLLSNYSMDEIADWIGTEHEVLKTTMDEYNKNCASKVVIHREN